MHNLERIERVQLPRDPFLRFPKSDGGALNGSSFSDTRAIKYCINRMMQKRMRSEKSPDRHFSRERWGCQTPGSQTVQAPDWYFHHLAGAEQT